MGTLPAQDASYYTDGTNADKEIFQRMQDTYSKAITVNQSFWSEADIDNRFMEGDQTLWNDIYGNLPAFRRRQFNFNRIRRVVNMVSGYQRQHRKSTIITPTENNDETTADQLSRALFWANDKSNALEYISQAFHGALVTGMNLLSVWLDYRTDPVNGDIRIDNLSYNGFLIDPYFRKHSLEDCNFIWGRRYLTPKQASELLPMRREDILNMKPRGNPDGKFYFLPESYNYGMADLLAYDEYWYLDTRMQEVLIDTKSGDTMEWEGSDEDLRRFLSVYPQIITHKQSIPTVKLAISVGDKVMYHGPNPLGIDQYPFVPVLAYYSPQIPYYPYRCQGMVRGLRDSQYLYNRRKVIELDIMESQVTSGFKYKESALVNPKDVFLSGQGRGIPIKDEAEMSDVEKIHAPEVPASMIELSKLLGQEISEISGVNEELLGAAQDDKAGVLSMLRQGAGLTTLQILFDQLDFSQKQLGHIFMRVIQKNWTEGKIRRILGEEPTQEFHNKNWQKYDAVVEEGLNTATQRQMQFAQLLQLRELQVPVPTKVLIEASTLQGKDKLVKAIMEEEQKAQEQQQKQEQIQSALIQAQAKDFEAKATANEGLGIERVSRIQENQALAEERRAEALKDLELGALHQVSALKELQALDIDNLGKLLALLKQIQEGFTDVAEDRPVATKMAVPKTDTATKPI